MDESVSAGVDLEPTDGRARRWPVRRRRRLSLALAGVAVLLLVGTFWRLPYYTLSPGSLRNTPPLVTVEGAPTYSDDGELGYLTVSFAQATPFSLLRAWVDEDIEVLDEETALGGRDLDENRALNARLMDNAKDTATAVALDALGYEVELLGTGAAIVGVEPSTPAAGVLQLGDVVVGVDGSPVTTSAELTDEMLARPPGTPVALRVERHDASVVAPEGSASDPVLEDVTLTLAARPDDPTLAYLGVRSATRDATWDLPFVVEVDSGNVIGPSAGLAFTLGIIDVLTPGSLTGGQVVAVTGTITPSGDVGIVGGVPQKAATAIGAGARIYLVPSVEVPVAAARAGGAMEVVGVANLLEALEALAELTGDRSVVDRVTANLAGEGRVPQGR